MAVSLLEQQCDVEVVSGHDGLLAHLRDGCLRHVPVGWGPIRFVVTSTTQSVYHCEFGTVDRTGEAHSTRVGSIFQFRRRFGNSADRFNVVY